MASPLIDNLFCARWQPNFSQKPDGCCEWRTFLHQSYRWKKLRDPSGLKGEIGSYWRQRGPIGANAGVDKGHSWAADVH